MMAFPAIFLMIDFHTMPHIRQEMHGHSLHADAISFYALLASIFDAIHAIRPFS